MKWRLKILKKRSKRVLAFGLTDKDDYFLLLVDLNGIKDWVLTNDWLILIQKSLLLVGPLLIMVMLFGGK